MRSLERNTFDCLRDLSIDSLEEEVVMMWKTVLMLSALAAAASFASIAACPVDRRSLWRGTRSEPRR